MAESTRNEQIATLAGGCFWCTEAIFRRLRGVNKVTSGYAGEGKPKPTYEEVASGQSGYVEAVQIQFDPQVISYEKILDVFWATHDPTTPNRQGADVGPQYRSVIFYHTNEQKNIAEQSKKRLAESKQYKNQIVTSIEPFTNFYPAEDSHQKFYEKNPHYPYCRLVIDPKIKKLYQNFGKDLKQGS